MSELLVLDPLEVAGGRDEFDITPFVGEAGPDFGDADIEQFLADAERGQLPVDYRLPNRKIQVPIIMTARAGLTFDEIRGQMQAKVALFQREGGWLKRETDAGPLFADVIGATLKLGGSTYQATRELDPDAVLTLDCVPDFYGDWVDGTDHVEAASGELIFTELDVKGDYPARVRITVDDDQGVRQRGVVVGLRSRHYSTAATSRLSYLATDLEPLGAAVEFGGSVVYSNLPANWSPMLSTDLGGVFALTHTGTYRVLARVQSTTDISQLRFVWDVGGLDHPEENQSWEFPSINQLFIADFGEIRIDLPPVGDHRWRGQFQGKGDSGTGAAVIEKVWFVPVDDGYCQVATSGDTRSQFLAYTARDQFNQSAGPLAGKVAEQGGTWTLHGDTDGFGMDTVFHRAERPISGPLDAGLFSGALSILGTSVYVSTGVQINVARQWDPGNLFNPPTGFMGPVVRFTDASNWVALVHSIFGGVHAAALIKVSAGVAEIVKTVPFTLPNITWGTLRLQILDDGSYAAWTRVAATNDELTLAPGDLTDLPLFVGQDADFVQGAQLGAGKVGFYEAQTSGVSFRVFDNFFGWVPTPPAAIHPGRSIVLRHDGVFGESADGGSYGPLSPSGDLLRLPPSGMEGRPCEVFIKTTRGDFDQLPDTAKDDLSATVSYRPSYLFTSSL